MLLTPAAEEHYAYLLGRGSTMIGSVEFDRLLGLLTQAAGALLTMATTLPFGTIRADEPSIPFVELTPATINYGDDLLDHDLSPYSPKLTPA